jgi:hypothetical protein
MMARASIGLHENIKYQPVRMIGLPRPDQLRHYKLHPEPGRACALGREKERDLSFNRSAGEWKCGYMIIGF